MGALDSGKTQLQAILAKLPESVRGAVAEVFTKPEANDALTLLGDSTLARSDYSKAMDELKSKEEQVLDDYTRLNTWYEKVKPKVDGYDALEQKVKQFEGAPRNPGETKTGLTREDLDQILQDRDQGYAGVLALSNNLTVKHYADFGEVLDMQDLMQHAANKKIGLMDAYRDKFGDQIKKKQDEAEATRINKLVEERLAEERKKQANLPYPLANGAPSVLDVLQTPDGVSKHTLDSAVAEYERLSMTRG